MTAVQARLERVATAQDLSSVLEETALDEARELARTLTDDPGSLHARYLLGWLHWYRYQALPKGSGQQDLQIAVTMLTPCFITGTNGLPELLLPTLADQAAPAAVELLELTQHSGDLGLLSATAELWQRILTATPADHSDRPGRLSNLGLALLIRYGRSGVAGDLDAAIDTAQQAIRATPADYPDRAGYLANLGAALLARYERTGTAADLDAAIDTAQQAVQATPADHPNRAGRLASLGIALRTRYERTGTAADLDAAIDTGQQAVRATPADYPDRAAILASLGNALLARYERTGTAADLDAAIDTAQQAVQATPADHPNRAMYLSNLGNALRTRYERTGTAADLNAAIDTGQQAVQATAADHPNRAGYLSNLGLSLRTRYERTGTAADLDAAIDTGQQAVQATPADHPDRAGRLANLGAALLARYERTGTAADLNAAIDTGQQAVQATPADHPDRAGYLSDLGIALLARFERTGATRDLDAAIDTGQQAVRATPADHPDRAGRLSNLGNALLPRYERTGAAADLDATVTRYRQAVQATPADHPDRAMYLSNLGAALRTRYERTGTAADLDAAIDTGQQAVRATPADHPDRAGRLSNLGIALRTRYERTGTAADLDAAIDTGQQAVRATPADHPDRAAILSNLGLSLRTRYERTGTAADLDAAIDTGQQAVRATPADHPNRAMYLSNLGASLRTRYERTGTAADLDAAIDTGQQAVRATPADHPNRAMYLSNLGIALLARYERTGTAADLDAAIDTGQQAVQATPADHPNRAMYLSNLGLSLRARYERTGAAPDLDAAVQGYSEAASVEVAAASVRIGAGRAAARLAAETDPEHAASLLEASVLLLPEVAARFLERGDQQYAIGRFAGLAAEAAAAALSDPSAPEPQRPARALRLLEAARGVMLSQALSTRGDLTELRERHPELAGRFTELRDWLDRPSPAAVGTDLAGLPGDGGAEALQHAIRDRRQAAAEFTRLLARIRGLDGFATFALPPDAEQLLAQGGQGPVVVFNVAAHRSDAIILTSGGITSQLLPGLNQTRLIGQVNAFHRALDTITSAGSLRDRVHAQETLREVLGWLWDNAAGPVLDALGYQAPPPPGQRWPRLWWVPGGLLSLLPVHAAGHYTSPPDPAGRAVMDRGISSYTPTVGALAHARSLRAGAPGGAPRSLIVAMPTTPDVPGQGRLRYVPAEAALLQHRLPCPTLLTEPSDGTTATDAQVPTRAAVLEHLPGSAIAHFACHGHTDPADPSQSRLLLHDHHNNPLTVAALAPLALDHAQLAYLSACSTARTDDTNLLDEAIHLATAFQLAGFPHVIGTLWEINDQIAVEIADAFYAALADPGGTLDSDRAARAIHHATRAQRDRLPATPYLCVAGHSG